MKYSSKKYRLVFILLPVVFFMLLVAARETTAPLPAKGVYILSYPENFGSRVYISAQNPLTREGVYLGRMLFYDPLLSADNTISCASCHRQELAFTDGLKLSHGINGVLAERNAMSLANLLWVNNFFWDGRVKTLETQAVIPAANPHEMNQPLEIAALKLARVKKYPALFAYVFGNDSITAGRISMALAQFERTLISANSNYDKYLRNEYTPTASERNGIQLFNTIPNPEKGIRGANCGRCHGTAKTMIELFHNNGLDSLPKDIGRQQLTGNEADHGRFRVPTLRNITLTAPYMHDGRFNTLEEVVNHYNEHVINSDILSPQLQNVSNTIDGKTLALTPQEQKDLISFLDMLTDKDFVSDPRFSNPHKP